MQTRIAARLMAATAASIAAVIAGIPASSEQARRSQTTHHSPLPRVTAGGQADWPLHNLDIKGIVSLVEARDTQPHPRGPYKKIDRIA